MRLTRVISRNETPDLIITKPGHLWRQQADVSGEHSLYVIIRFIERSTGRCSTGERTPFTWSRQEELLPLHGGQLARHEGARMFTSAVIVGKTFQIRAVLSSEAVRIRNPDG